MRLKAALKLDLPSQEICTQPGAFARFFGAQPRPTGQERVFGSALAVLDCFVAAFHAMGVRNVIALKIDQTPIYLDNAMVDDDFNAMVGAINSMRSVLDHNFKVIHLVLEHSDGGIHYVLDTKIRGQVPVGDEEVYIVISGKIEALNPVPNETAPEFRVRIRNVINSPGFFESYRQQFQTSIENILDRLKLQTNAAGGRVEYAELGVTRPTKNTVSHVAGQKFGAHQRSFRGGAVTRGAVGYDHDPYSYYYFNPFDTLVNLLIIDALLSHTAVGLPGDALIYNFDGQPLGDAAHVDDLQQSLGDVTAIASEQAFDGFEQGTILTDPNLASEMGGYGSDNEVVAPAGGEAGFDTGDAGFFDDPGPDTSATSCACTESSCSSSSCSASSCSSCSSCASCSSCC